MPIDWLPASLVVAVVTVTGYLVVEWQVRKLGWVTKIAKEIHHLIYYASVLIFGCVVLAPGPYGGLARGGRLTWLVMVLQTGYWIGSSVVELWKTRGWLGLLHHVVFAVVHAQLFINDAIIQATVYVLFLQMPSITYHSGQIARLLGKSKAVVDRIRWVDFWSYTVVRMLVGNTVFIWVWVDILLLTRSQPLWLMWLAGLSVPFLVALHIYWMRCKWRWYRNRLAELSSGGI